MPVTSSDVHQVICAYDPDNPSDNKGFGPVAVSFAMAEALSLFKLAGQIMRPPGDSLTELDSVACALLPSGQELLVRRIVARDALRRGNVLSQALVGAPGQFCAELGLGLGPADWPLGENLADVRLGEPLHRVDYADLRHRGVDGAARLRTVSRNPALAEPLRHLVTWVLSEPAQRLSIAASLVGDQPRAVLLGLVDILGPLVPGPWTLSTLESVESGPYRLIIMEEWPRTGSPDYGRLRLVGQQPPEGPAHTTASLLVDRYQEHGLEGLNFLSLHAQLWQRMQPVERAESLLGTLVVQPAEPVHLALPAGTESGSAATAYGRERTGEAGGPVESAANTVEEQPEAVSQKAPRVPDPPVDPPPVPGTPTRRAKAPAPVPVPDAEHHPCDSDDLVGRLIGSHPTSEDRKLRLTLENAVGGWSEQEIDAACRRAIDLRLGLQGPLKRVIPWGSVTADNPRYFYDVLISGTLHREQPARAWAEFLLVEAGATLPEPLRSVVRRMYEQLDCQSITVHPVFFRVLGDWAIPRALGLDSRDSPPARPVSGGDQTQDLPFEGGTAPNLRLIAKVFLFIYAPLAMLVVLVWLTLL
ncbi:hypothetical protein [Streptomyces sp. IB201691-2A2]|uniref:hypothetical protein n=1 Tax=Streptomyces sp. IB201691-2A2 TaxID=2561920 RepID=UPI0011808513|nr:hypothetical protein [Streptomyces sp. IB201691-2A2]TRO58554.1 hypothetical protein E4K73_38530 [Streptomyces sp. IB201691-2A2]